MEGIGIWSLAPCQGKLWTLAKLKNSQTGVHTPVCQKEYVNQYSKH